MTGLQSRYCGGPVWKLDIREYERLVWALGVTLSQASPGTVQRKEP